MGALGLSPRLPLLLLLLLLMLGKPAPAPAPNPAGRCLPPGARPGPPPQRFGALRTRFSVRGASSLPELGAQLPAEPDPQL